MMCVAGFDGYFKRVNPAFERILGYSSDELLSRPFLEFVHPDDRESTERVVKKLAEGGDVIHFDNRYRCKDGTYKWLSWSTPAPRTGDELLYAVARDITEKRKVEEDLRRAMKAAEAADRAKSAFLANMSHEIRTPMNGVIGMADLMAHTTLTEEQHEYLQVIQQSADSLLSLLNDILDLSKIESGKLELEQIDFSLRDTIGYAGQMFSVRAAEKELEVACRVAPDVPDVLVGGSGHSLQESRRPLALALLFGSQKRIDSALNGGNLRRSLRWGDACPAMWRVSSTGVLLLISSHRL
jgi:PAS domain S-box-containing protein